MEKGLGLTERLKRKSVMTIAYFTATVGLKHSVCYEFFSR